MSSFKNDPKHNDPKNVAEAPISDHEDEETLPEGFDFDAAEASYEARTLEHVIGEAKDHLDARPGDIDWSRLEARVMSEVAKDGDKTRIEAAPANVTAIATARRHRLLRVSALAFAAAAAVVIFVRRDGGSVWEPGSQHDKNATNATSPREEKVLASSLRATEGAGEIRIGSHGDGSAAVAALGSALHAGDDIDADGARAVFERSRKVAWLVEQDGAAGQARPLHKTTASAHAHVKSAGESLILGLDHGVIEAQVVPVASGEAFAVDVATDRSLVRVAVHGTHLRVARAGTRVVVDLTEGVVSIGVPPRTGITVGTLVTAPAHVELDANDLGSIRVDHSPSAVREAVSLGTSAAIAAGEMPVMAAATPRQEAPTLLTPPQPVAPVGPSLAVNNTTNPKPAVEGPSNINAPANANAKPDTQPKIAAVLPPRDVITAGIRDCAAKHARSKSNDAANPENSTRKVTVSSTLRLKVSPAGAVEQAQFTPPLTPEIQTCAAQVIYKTKLEETGSVSIPVEFSY